jgi:hypothetical protein
MIDAVVFDVGETLVNETQEYGAWADWLGVPRHGFSAVFGAVIAMGMDYRDTFQFFRPGFSLDEERARRADVGQPETFGEDDLYPDARPSMAALCDRGIWVGVVGNQNLAGANLSNAAITDARGMIMQNYYGEDGTVTTPAPMHYQASDFPVAASFSDETVCPNGDTYAVNVDASLTIAQMMVAPHPPTSWAPRDLGRKAEGQRTKQSNRNITDHG